MKKTVQEIAELIEEMVDNNYHTERAILVAVWTRADNYAEIFEGIKMIEHAESGAPELIYTYKTDAYKRLKGYLKFKKLEILSKAFK